MKNEELKPDSSESTPAAPSTPVSNTVLKPTAKPVAKATVAPETPPVAPSENSSDKKIVSTTASRAVSEPTVKETVKKSKEKVKEPTKSVTKSAILKTDKKNTKEKAAKDESPRIKKPKPEKFNYELRIDLLGKAIKKARKERKLTQKELGQLVGVKKAQISKVENSFTDARFETIIKVFKALNVNIKFNIEMLDQTIKLS
jgi:DNA-binding XRE family transcriptional regulator